jgi:hypothetical protein
MDEEQRTKQAAVVVLMMDKSQSCANCVVVDRRMDGWRMEDASHESEVAQLCASVIDETGA